MRHLFTLCCCFLSVCLFGQSADSVYYPNIKTAQLYKVGSQVNYPIIRLNSGDQLNLKFDDLDADAKNYYFTYQLCNQDWSPVVLSTFDYIRGFTQERINDYRFSSVALTKYTHYEAVVPTANAVPTHSGNYLLKVFLDGDTSRLAFTKRFLVVEDGVSVVAEYLQPQNPQYSQTHQKLQFSVNTRALNLVNPMQQIKVMLLQNYRWDNAVFLDQPAFFSGNTFQYNSDDLNIFPGGKQWRWVDLQSFRFQSDRIAKADYSKTATTIYVKPDAERTHQPYYYYADYNGWYYIQTTESIDPNWQTDYATVNFTFLPPDSEPFNDKEVYIIGKMTDYKYNEATRMKFNATKNVYENSLLLKQGFYNYAYVTVDHNDPLLRPSFEFTEGNTIETENDYMILVYFRALGGRADQLIGLYRLNSLTGRQ